MMSWQQFTRKPLARVLSALALAVLAVLYFNSCQATLRENEQVFTETRGEFRANMKANLAFFREHTVRPDLVRDIQPFSGDDDDFNFATLRLKSGWASLPDKQKVELQEDWARVWGRAVLLRPSGAQKPALWIKSPTGGLIETWGISDEDWARRGRVASPDDSETNTPQY